MVTVKLSGNDASLRANWITVEVFRLTCGSHQDDARFDVIFVYRL